ncbi:NADPH:quinone reductase [Saccharomycopsis crataegensis]|uniref:NADPH:quinone reductase n=1 Tax=Saccharomycopsis crataegensis TaxID=43959 RepID=A0AAV5QQA7_9ASCO|nr:NADPH:quinone reductase [Saccharomycopsis crataegensis]
MSIPKTQKVILFEEIGGPEVLKYADFPVPAYADDEILIKNHYAGVNYIESYFRTGIYPSQKPYVLGREASGEVVAIGAKVGNFKVGDKVTYISSGTFSQYQKIKATGNIYKLPKDINDEALQVMGSILVQGLTAITFSELAYPIRKGDYVLIYAAAGGVGQILCQLCKLKGAHAIALASTDEKLALVQKLGAEYTINSKATDIVEQVLKITGGKGVHGAFDSIGKDTFQITLKCLRTNGKFVSYGNATGKIPAFEINTLPRNVSICRPTLYHNFSEPGEFKHYMDQLYEFYISGQLEFNIFKTFPLEEYPEAAKLLESRATAGKLSLKIPQ